MARKKKTPVDTTSTKKVKSVTSGKRAALKKKTTAKQKKVAGKKKPAAAKKKIVAKEKAPAKKKRPAAMQAAPAPAVAPVVAPPAPPAAPAVAPPAAAVAPPAAAGSGERLITPDEVREERTRRWTELIEQRKRAEQVFQRCQDALLARPDVTGVSVGWKLKNNQVVSPLQYCIRVHVLKKWPEDHPLLRDKLPTDFEGIPVDVVERSYSLAQGTDPLGRFVEPLCGGIPIANQNSPGHFGTLGVVMFSDGLPRYLTNQHVVGFPTSSSSANPVRQPPNGVTTGGMDANIGNVLDAERSAEMDAAIIEPTGNRQFDFGVIGHDGVKLNGTFVPSVLTVADEQVTKCFKIGAVTGSPELLGVVSNTSSSIKIQGFGVMKNQIVVASEEGVNLIDPGDSGSILIAPRVNADGSNLYLVVGLVHARRDDDGAIIACHLNKVQSRFNISLFN